MTDTLEAPEGTETRLRVEIAACTLLLNREGILGYSGHVSARLPEGDLFLVQPRDTSRARLTPEEILVCDLNGRVVRGAEGLRPPSEVFLHCEIYRARPDVGAVAHFHHDLTNIFTLVEGVPLVPYKNHAVRWESGIPVHENPAHVHTPELGTAIARTLGAHHAMQIRAHGQIVTAETVRALFVDSIHFVENAETAYRAAAIGKLKPLTAGEMADFNQGVRRDHHTRKLWSYYVGNAIVDKVLPSAWSLSD